MQITVECCPVCGGQGRDVGDLTSPFSGIEFHFQHCGACGYTFIVNPRVDFDQLYDERYYAGFGADTNVEYLREMYDPQTLRQHEWQGVLDAVTALHGSRPQRWLDLGCGLGGLVRYARDRGVPEAYGLDEGWSAAWMAANGIPRLAPDEVEQTKGTFDVVTAIEVIEHVPDPVGLMTAVAGFLRPGGVFFLTTGNAAPHQRHFLRWPYVNGDVHVGYFEPRTLATVYERAGLVPEFPGSLPGHADIIRYKVLRALRVHRRNPIEAKLPWPLLSRVVDRRHRVTDHPTARRPAA